MRIFVFLLIVVVVATSCYNKKVISAEDKAMHNLDLIDADKSFSALSKEKGMKLAYIDFIDSNGVLLRPDYAPIIGANAIDFLIRQDDKGYSLSWNPQYAEVAESGELGYTYGVYAIRPNNMDTVIYGTYTSIWKKQLDGKWKLLLNSGNQGMNEQ